MPIGNITQTISTISPPPHRGVDVQTVFVTKQEDFQDHLADITINELNTLKTQLNARIGEINSTTTTMDGYANTASASASTATTKASEASTSASQALTKASEASTSASTATTKASEASASASQALTSRNQAETFAQQASASALSVNTSNMVHRTGDETIAGVKTFSSNIVGNITGTADYAKYQQMISGQTTCDAYFKATPAGKTSFNEINSLSDAPTATDWYLLQNIRHSNGSNFWGSQIAYSLNSGTSNKIWQRTIDAGTWSSWTRVDVSGANISELVNNVGYITADGRAYPKRVGGGDINFNWSGQGGQPNWLWGGNDADSANMYVYSPYNFSVNYANTCWRANDLSNHQWDSKATNGYIRLSTGFIIQWGEIYIQTKGHVNWSTTFPNVCVQATVSQGYAGSTSTDALASIYNLSTTGADIQNGQDAGGIMRYIVIGW